MSEAQLLRIRLQQDDEWPPVDREEVLGQQLADGRYQVLTAPAFARHLSVDDVVAVSRDAAGELWVDAVVERGGHSTVRVNVLRPEMSDDLTLALTTRGCRVEPAPLPHLLTVDVPETADYGEVRRYLEAGENAGDWEFQEAAISLRHDMATIDFW